MERGDGMSALNGKSALPGQMAAPVCPNCKRPLPQQTEATTDPVPQVDSARPATRRMREALALSERLEREAAEHRAGGPPPSRW